MLQQQDFLSKNNGGLGWLHSDTDLFETPSKPYSSWTQEPYLFVQESKLNELIDRRVSQKIDEFLAQRKTIHFRTLSNTDAKKEILAFILERHKRGIFKVSIFDMVVNLRLPASQVEGVMEGFVKKGKAKEI